MTVEITVLVTIVSGFVALAMWLAGRDKKITHDGEWRGSVNKSLDNIEKKLDCISFDVTGINKKLDEHAERLAKVESSAKQAHHRIDKIEGGK